MSQIDAATNSKIRRLCSQGDKLSKLGDYDRAVSKYYEALTLLPDMHGRDNISAFLYASIGEAYWNMKDFENAGQSFCEAYECPGMNENAQITLRIGQCLIECGDVDNARDYLRHAVRLGGDELIKSVDRRYMQVLQPDSRNAKQSGLYASGVTRGAPYGEASDGYTGGPAASGANYRGGETGAGGAQQAPGTGSAAYADAQGNDEAGRNGASSFSFVSEVFGEQQRPAESSRFTMFAEDVKPKEQHDPFNDNTRDGSYAPRDNYFAQGGQDVPAERQDGSLKDPYSGEKPEKQGFFSRIFGKKK